MNEVRLTLPVRPPFRLDLTVWVLRRRTKNNIDAWDGQSYRRVFTQNDKPVLATISQETSNLNVKLESSQAITASGQTELEKLIRQMLGLDVDLEPFYKLTTGDPTLKELAEQFKGVRPPRFPSIFETLINAIACQQVSLDVGILLLNRLASNFGKPLGANSMALHAFPEPHDLMDVDEVALKNLGFSYQKARSIINLSLAIASNDLNLKRLESASNERAFEILQSLRGIGRWSTEYALLRGLGRLDVFPGDDIGGKNNLQRLLKLDVRPSYEELGQLVAKWHPYAGLIYFHLLLKGLQEKGLV